ncbi:MAG: DUF354 domain-containing protein [Phycisphaerae bacterium]
MEKKIKNRVHIWIDLENTPNVPFFEPIVKRLREMNHTVYITCRDYSDIPALSKLYDIQGSTVGRHGGKNKVKKVFIGLLRSMLLAKWARKKQIDIAVGFGSRTLAVASRLLKIPNATVLDYEHASMCACRFCDWIFAPEEVSSQYLIERGIPEKKLIKYTGLKEEVYAGVYKYNNGLLDQLKYDEEKVVVTIRPPATKAHYHDHLSEIICRRVLERIVGDSFTMAIFVRRDGDSTFDRFLQYENIKTITAPVKGLDLIINSDLVISGGGTMVREAAALGVPAYSIFTGKMAAVDERLARQRRLILIRKPKDVSRIQFVKRDKQVCCDGKKASVLEFFVNEFVRLARKSRS